MAEVINLPVDSLEEPRDIPNDLNDKPPVDDNFVDLSPPPSRRREKDSRERRDDRDFDHPPNRRGGGDYNDRNRSPLPPLPRDRERDYKRRLSPSPPPYRDRRPYSPSRRSPPFKRPRREDSGYDGRRGGPRGYGNDRRFRNEYPGEFERDMGGRPSYLDDRPYGRPFGRSSGGYSGGGLSDWDSGRGDYSDLSNSGNNPREGLMSYKQFIQELEDDVLPSEAESRYKEYKTEYITTQKRTYFEAHKDEEWLKNKYHPTNLISVIERRNELARKVAKDFLLDLQSAELDLGPCASTNKSEQQSEPSSENGIDGGAVRRQPTTKEAELVAAPKAHPISSEPRRIQFDVELTLNLARKLDSEKGINGNILVRPDNDKIRDKSQAGSMGPVVIVRGLTSVKGLEGVELLDTLLTYLWRIHGVDYYGMTEITEPKGLRHVRAERKASDGSKDGNEWENKLNSHWEDRLGSEDPLEAMTAKEKIDTAAMEALDPHVRKIRDEKYGWKYGCGAKGCTKLFHAAEFVQKHLKLKHPELAMELTSKVREDLYFQNYMNDPNAPGGQPVAQQTIQKDKLQRRRLPLENRLKDDRGIRRGRVARGSGNDNNDDPENGNADEPMFDDFGGQGMHTPFPPDIAPSVLMPVPGAGPLGPFIPAPPEVAMQMMRDQGGPPPFDVGGRNVHSRLGASSIILPPNFQQDPRRLRSYQDLDAPDDEVTVIDYRSL